MSPSGPRIHLLERDVAERIAAGEVIERPVSVVKELVENSLDAGARRILVELRGGGLESLRVQDDGHGMSRQDLELAVQRFATSKIREWEDLDRLGSFGFRGEALPSIGAVSRLEIATREPHTDWGWKLQIRGGEVQAIEEAGTPVGTVITVTDLFFNTPARRKFLKGAVVEAMRVQEVLGGMGLAALDVHLTLRHNGKEMMDLPAGSDLTEDDALAKRLRQLWSLKGDQPLMAVRQQGQDLSVTGCVSGPGLLWPNRRRLLIFVNRRMVSVPSLTHAVSDALGVGRGRYPMGALRVEIPPEQVDVNVHPTKAEVRFRDNDTVYRLVRDAVARALRRQPSGVPLMAPASADWRHAASDPFAGWPDPLQPPELRAREPIVQTRSGHLVTVRDGDLWLVDPHAFQERRLLRRLTRHPVGEALLFPLMLEFPPRVANRLTERVADLATLGIELEDFGPQTFLVRKLPPGLEGLAQPGRLDVVLTEALSSHDFTTAVLELAACRAACPPASVLPEALAESILAELEDGDLQSSPGIHGLPSAVRLPGDALQRLFNRA